MGTWLLEVRINLIWTWWQIKLFLEILKVKTLTQGGNRRSEQPKLFDPFTTFIKPSWEPVWRGVGDPWDLLKFTRKPLTKKKEACKIEIGFQHWIYVSRSLNIELIRDHLFLAFSPLKSQCETEGIILGAKMHSINQDAEEKKPASKLTLRGWLVIEYEP